MLTSYSYLSIFRLRVADIERGEGSEGRQLLAELAQVGEGDIYDYQLLQRHTQSFVVIQQALENMRV